MLRPLRRRRLPSAHSSSKIFCGWIFVPRSPSWPAIFRAHAVASQAALGQCSRKMRMSGLSKVEMSAFMDGWGVHGDGAYRLEPARTGATEGAARGKAEAFDAGGGRRAAEGDRPSGPAAALGPRGARGWCRGSRAARSSLESQAARFVRAKGSGPCAAAVCGLRAYAGRRTLSQGRMVGEPRDPAEMDDSGPVVAPPLPAREGHPCVARTASLFWRDGDAG